jgi:hypothetical protein
MTQPPSDDVRALLAEADWINAETCIENGQIAYDDAICDEDDTPVDTVVDAGDLGVLLGLARYAVSAHFTLSQPVPSPANVGEGWIVCSGDGKRFRTWENGFSAWTDSREGATRYARREDAEAVHQEDEDAWSIVPFTPINGEAIPVAEADVAAGYDLGMALSTMLEAQMVQPYRGWNITALNKAAASARELLGLPSVRDLNPDIAKMQDHALANRDAIRSLSTPPQPDANHSSALDVTVSAAAFHRAAEIALTFRPRGENAKHFVDVLVCDIAAAIRQEGQDA